MGIEFIGQQKMVQKIFDLMLILFPVSLILSFLLVRLFKVERKIDNYLIIFALIFGTLILIYFIFTI